jgi:hypothetical protein
VTTLLLLAGLWWQQPPPPEAALTNADVVELVRSGLAEGTITRLIETRRHSFDVSVPDLIALKRAGVSDQVIRLMLVAATGRVARSPAPAAVPEERGVYWEGPEGLRRLPAERITLRGPRGFETDTGVIGGTRSAVTLTTPLSFVIRTPDHVAPEEYLLVQLFVRKDRREFRTLTGGLWRGDGIERMAVPFESERLGRNLYRVRIVALPRGEFGFLQPGTQLPVARAAARPETTAGLPPPARPGAAQLPTDGSAGAMFTFSVP